jgi:hypothetical protein
VDTVIIGNSTAAITADASGVAVATTIARTAVAVPTSSILPPNITVLHPMRESLLIPLRTRQSLVLKYPMELLPWSVLVALQFFLSWPSVRSYCSKEGTECDEA